MKRIYVEPETLLIHTELTGSFLAASPIDEDGSSPTKAGDDEDDDGGSWIVNAKHHNLWDDDSAPLSWDSFR